jgi:flavin reductase (DIM6/NTAB) family NADH-FMN oxidoreductase RutF
MFGRFASGVTIVTCGQGASAHGMTANSFTSVSLDPATGLVAISRDSRMHRKLLASDRFAVSVLADCDHAVSDHFAGRGSGDIPCLRDRHEVATIEGALAWMVLEREAEFDVATHTLFVGRVLDCGYREDAAPLIFFGGNYQALARISQ